MHNMQQRMPPTQTYMNIKPDIITTEDISTSRKNNKANAV